MEYSTDFIAGVQAALSLVTGFNDGCVCCAEHTTDEVLAKVFPFLDQDPKDIYGNYLRLRCLRLRDPSDRAKLKQEKKDS